MSSKIIKGVKEYYTSKINQHGDTHLGVDWNSTESQYLRFEQLCKLVQTTEPFSILDYGCGYGELVQYLSGKSEFSQFKYTGFDISDKMIFKAQSRYKDQNINFSIKMPDIKYDYLVASGIFNVKLDLANNHGWEIYVKKNLFEFNKLSTRGFSFNMLTAYSDQEKMKNHLFYADPSYFFDFCKKNFSRNVALLHDYDLYEFTIIVRK